MRSFLLLLTLGLAAGRPEDPPADIAGGVEATRGVSKDARITPEYTEDRTSDLFGMTVYAEYLYYPDYWIVPWNYLLPHYTGTVYGEFDETEIYEPKNKAQLRFFDCGDGYACIQSAYDNYYLGLSDGTWDMNFYEEDDFFPVEDGYQFKVLCSDRGFYSFEQCNLVGYRRNTVNLVYATSGGFLKYCDDCGEDDWFRFRLLAIQPIDEYRDIPVSPCNTNNDFLEVRKSYIEGVDTGDFEYEPIVSDELSMNFEHAANSGLLSEKFYWLGEADSDSTSRVFDSAHTVNTDTTFYLPPGQQASIRQLVGVYGKYVVYSDSGTDRFTDC